MKIRPILRSAGIILFCLAFSGKMSGQEILNRPKDKQSVVADPLYLLTYDHGGLVLWGTDHFAKYLRSAISWLDSYPGFKIGLDNEAYTYDFLKLKDTLLLSELKGYLRKYNGRFGIGTCTYGQPLSQFINEESNIRQIGYALETDNEIFRYKPTVYLMSEHAMHSQIPQILKGFGFSGAIMRTHFMMYGYNPAYNASVGWWTGRDGSRIAAIPTYKGEGSGFGWVTEDNLILTRYPGPECRVTLEAFREKFSAIGPLLATRADDSGLRKEELVKEYEGKPGYKWILLDEVFRNFPPPTAEFRTDPDDFHVRMPWGYCGNEIWNMSREAEVKVLTAERLAAIESIEGGRNHESGLDRSWKNLLVAQHHDIQICGILQDSRRFLPASISISDSIINAAMTYLSSKMEGGDLAQITVFNPVSWSRREWIDVEISIPSRIDNIIVQKGNSPIPFEVISKDKLKGTDSSRWHLIILAEVPPLALGSYSVIKAGPVQNPLKTIEFDKDKLRIVTPFWIIDLEKNGGISAITDRRKGNQLLAGHRSAYFEGVINGKPQESTAAWDLDSVSVNNREISIHQNGNIGTIPFRLEMKLTDISPRIDFKAKFLFNDEMIGRVSDNKKEITSAFLHEEKLRFKVFPNLGIGTTGVRDLPFTIAETDNKYIEGNYWTALADGHSGIAFFNRGTMGSVHEEDGSFSLPLAYSMYYVWKTVMLKGDFSYHFALYPFEGRWEGKRLQNEALDYNFPLVARISGKGNKKSGNEIRPLVPGSDGILLSAFYTRGGKLMARFYESKGNKDTLTLKINSPLTRLIEVDLAGDELNPVILPLAFTPWQIRTFVLADRGIK